MSAPSRIEVVLIAASFAPLIVALTYIARRKCRRRAPRHEQSFLEAIGR